MYEDFDDEYFSYDNRSISSEGSTLGVLVADPTYHGNEFFSSLGKSTENLNQEDIEYSLSLLPNAALIKEMIEENDVINEETFKNNVDHIHTALLFSVWYRNLENVKTLLENCTADPNASDLQGRSALHLACFVGDERICELLLKNEAAPQNWDKVFKITPLHCAAISGNKECLKLLIEAGTDVKLKLGPFPPILFAVQKNNVEFLEALLSLGANPDVEEEEYGLNALHISVVTCHIQCTRILIQFHVNVNSKCGSKKITALHLAASDNNKECVELLLDAHADIDARNTNLQTPLHLACLTQCQDTLAYLIKRGADLHTCYKEGRNALHASVLRNSSTWTCTKLLLYNKIDVNKADDYGYTALHIAVINEFSKCATILIDSGADMTLKTNGGMSGISFILRRTPEVFEKFLRKLDNSIIAENVYEIGDLDCIVKLDFRPLVPNTDRRETDLISAIIKNGRRKVLQHPLIDTFLYLKWLKIRKVFYVHIGIYLLFALLFSVYYCKAFLVSEDFCFRADLTKSKLRQTFLAGKRSLKFSGQLMDCDDDGVNLTDVVDICLNRNGCDEHCFASYGELQDDWNPNCTFFNKTELISNCTFGFYGTRKLCEGSDQTDHEHDENSMYLIWFSIIILIYDFLFMCLELFQMIHDFKKYFTYSINFVQWLMIAGVFLCSFHSIEKFDRQHDIAAVTVCLVWWMFMMHLGRLPLFSLYIQMFKTVAMNFVKFLLAYCSLLIAFGLSFMVLFPEVKSFKNIPSTILKTIVMMAGELEFNDLFESGYLPFTAQVVFFFFVLLVTIILSNLLVGLAVSDIQGIQKSAGLDRMVRQATIIYNLEGLFLSNMFENNFLKVKTFLQSLMLWRTPQNKLQIKIRPNDPRENQIPKEQRKAIHKLVTENQCSEIQKQQYRTSLMQRKQSVEEKKQFSLPEVIVPIQKPKLKFMKFNTFDAPSGTRSFFGSRVTLRRRELTSVQEPLEESRPKRYSIRDLKIKNLLKSSDESEKDHL